MDYDLSFLNKTEILPNINLMGLGRLSARNADCNIWWGGNCDCNCDCDDFNRNCNCDCDACDCDDCNCDWVCDWDCDCDY